MANESRESDSVTRAEVQRSFDKVAEKLGIPSRDSLKQRRALLKRQAKEILAKYGCPKSQERK
jgi:hypothetical protein